MKHLLQRIIASILVPAPATRLGILRALIGVYALWYVWTRHSLILSFGTNPAAFEPVGVLGWLSEPPSEMLVHLLLWLTIVSGMLFVAGVGFRISGPSFAVLLLVTLCYRNSWSMIYHMHNTLAIHVIILGITKSADGFSLDWVWNRYLRQRGGACLEGLQPASWVYGWPIRLICAVTAVAYFLAGFAKLAGPEGLGWASGESMRAQIAVDAIRKEVLEGKQMGFVFWLYGQKTLFLLMGVTTLVLELGAPLFLLSRKWSVRWAWLTFAMHWGIYCIMGISFRYQLTFIAFLSFFHIETIGSTVLTWIKRLESKCTGLITARSNMGSS